MHYDGCRFYPATPLPSEDWEAPLQGDSVIECSLFVSLVNSGVVTFSYSMQQVLRVCPMFLFSLHLVR